ncbi:hypothetical protein ACTDI4_05505 [Mesorhizobium sp. PUT5]|uniref:hypothetical protein n=1 Tax=Mesorhizobium sp. PUT5 TaxID=3454629 RepID=UPI003FA42122
MTQPTTGGLGGLGGYLSSPGFGNLLQAAGMSLMSSPRNNPLQDFGKFYGGLQTQQMKQDEIDQQRASLASVLKAAGFSDDEAMQLSANPTAAKIAIEQRQAQEQKAADDRFFSSMPKFGSLGDLGGAADGPSAASTGNYSYPAMSDASAPDIAPKASSAPTQTQFGLHGVAQLDPYNFNLGQTPPDDRALEPVANIPQEMPVAQFPIPPGTVHGKSPPGLPATAQRGAIMRGSDGKNYQYIQLSGGTDGNGEWGWGEVNLDGPGGQLSPDQSSGNKTVDWLKANDPEAAQLLDQGFSVRDVFGIAQIRRQGQKQADETQAKLDQLYRHRDQYAEWASTARNDKTYTVAKRSLDNLDNQIARLEKQQTKYAPPDGFRALELRAEAAGLQPGTPEYQRFMASGGGDTNGNFKVVGNRMLRVGPDDQVTDVTPPSTAQVGSGIYNLDSLPVVPLGDSGAPDPYVQQEFLSQLEPATANLVKGVADYRIPIEKVTSMRGGERQELAKLVSQYDPTFDMSQYPARAAMRKSITSGNYSQSLNSANLVIQHLDALQKAAGELDNTGYPSINWAVNTGKQQLGKPSITAFNTAADALASELAKVFKGAGASSLEEIRTWRSNLSPNASPEQIKASAQMVMELLKSRIDTINSQYTAAMGKPAEFTFLTPHSREVLQDLGFDPAQLDPLAAGDEGSRGAGGEGGRSRINNPAGARRAVNPQTGEAIEWDGSQWRPLQ